MAYSLLKCLIIFINKCDLNNQFLMFTKWICDVMIYMLASSEPWSGQINAYKIGIYCSSAKHVALRSQSKDWLARN